MQSEPWKNAGKQGRNRHQRNLSYTPKRIEQTAHAVNQQSEEFQSLLEIGAVTVGRDWIGELMTFEAIIEIRKPILRKHDTECGGLIDWEISENYSGKVKWSR